MLFHYFPEACQALPCDCRITTVYVCDLCMFLFNNVGNQIRDSFFIIGNNTDTVRKYPVDRYDREITFDQFDHFGIFKVDTCNDNSVKPSVPAVFQIRHSVFSLLIAIKECDIVSLCLCCDLEAVKQM